MSDYDDEMDVDASPAWENTIRFSAEAKGKRSAANLPVEAEDTLPWSELYPRDPFKSKGHAKGRRRTRVEKYRPSSLDDVAGHGDILTTIDRFVDSNVGRCPSDASTRAG